VWGDKQWRRPAWTERLAPDADIVGIAGSTPDRRLLLPANVCDHGGIASRPESLAAKDSAGGGMHGLKNVSHRHDDALSRIGWAELERLLATYYREVGWWVEHSDTGGTGAKFDGGVDLRIRRDAQVVLVQCKHWNAKQVPHDAVHELLGVMINEGATGAILVSSGEFTRAAIDAAQRHGHVKLIDGETLRGMLGPLPEPEPPPCASPASAVRGPKHSGANLLFWLVALAFAIAFILIVREVLDRTADTASEPATDTRAPAVQPTIVI
jgi:restriction system protein